MPVLHVHDVDLAYSTRGEGEPLLLISGLGYGAWCWHAVAPLLAAHFRVLTFDNRGAGGSSKPPGPYTTRQLAEDALGLLEGLGVPRAHVVGHSLGGMVAQELALAAPSRVGRLVLVSTTHGGPRAVPVTPGALAVMADRSGEPRALFHRGVEVATARGFVARHPEVVEALWQYRCTDPVPPPAYAAQLAAGLAHDSEARLAQLAAPCLVVTGEEDRVVPPANAERLAARIPGARLRTLPGVGHLVPLEAPGALAALVRDFLTGAARATG